MANKKIQKKIEKALRNSKYKWRTALGIAKELKLLEEDVTKILDNNSVILKAKKSNKNGQCLYTLRNNYKKSTSFIQRLAATIRNEAY